MSSSPPTFGKDNLTASDLLARKSNNHRKTALHLHAHETEILQEWCYQHSYGKHNLPDGKEFYSQLEKMGYMQGVDSAELAYEMACRIGAVFMKLEVAVGQRTRKTVARLDDIRQLATAVSIVWGEMKGGEEEAEAGKVVEEKQQKKAEKQQRMEGQSKQLQVEEQQKKQSLVFKKTEKEKQKQIQHRATPNLLSQQASQPAPTPSSSSTKPPQQQLALPSKENYAAEEENNTEDEDDHARVYRDRIREYKEKSMMCQKIHNEVQRYEKKLEYAELQKKQEIALIEKKMKGLLVAEGREEGQGDAK